MSWPNFIWKSERILRWHHANWSSLAHVCMWVVNKEAYARNGLRPNKQTNERRNDQNDAICKNWVGHKKAVRQHTSDQMLLDMDWTGRHSFHPFQTNNGNNSKKKLRDLLVGGEHVSGIDPKRWQCAMHTSPFSHVCHACTHECVCLHIASVGFDSLEHPTTWPNTLLMTSAHTHTNKAIADT